MNKKTICMVFAVEAVVCVLFTMLSILPTNIFAAIMTFPFEQISIGLRLLSLSGAIGNGIAILLYAVICLIPCMILLLIKRKRSFFLEDGFLILISVLLFPVFYQMINPGLITLAWASDGTLVAKIMLGGMVYSLVCTYVVLRVLRLFFTSTTDCLHKYMEILLILINGIFVFLIFGVGVSSLIHSFETLREKNVGNEQLLGVSYVFLVLQFIVDNVPFVLDMVVVFIGISLLHAFASDRYSEETVYSAEKLSNVCRYSLMIAVLSNAGFHILQFLCFKNINIVNFSVPIPLFSIIFVLAVLIFSRFVSENKALKDDNDSII